MKLAPVRMAAAVTAVAAVACQDAQAFHPHKYRGDGGAVAVGVAPTGLSVVQSFATTPVVTGTTVRPTRIGDTRLAVPAFPTVSFAPVASSSLLLAETAVPSVVLPGIPTVRHEVVEYTTTKRVMDGTGSGTGTGGISPVTIDSAAADRLAGAVNKLDASLQQFERNQAALAKELKESREEFTRQLADFDRRNPVAPVTPATPDIRAMERDFHRHMANRDRSAAERVYERSVAEYAEHGESVKRMFNRLEGR